MSEDTQKWIRDSQDYLERIRGRFSDYCSQLKKFGRSEEEDVKIKDDIQNQWRKLNDFLNKELPPRMNEYNKKYFQGYNYLQNEAKRVENLFVGRFGAIKHIQLKNKELKNLWEKDVVRSGLRGLSKSQKKMPRQQQIIIQEEEASTIIAPTPSLIFQNEDETKYEKLDEAQRRSEKTVRETVEMQFLNRKVSVLFLSLLLILCLILVLMNYVGVELNTGLFSWMFDL